MGKVYGYVRVSSMEQNEDRQMAALKQVGVVTGNFLWTNSRGTIFMGQIMYLSRSFCVS